MSEHTPGPWKGEYVCIVGPTNEMRPHKNKETGEESLHPTELIALVYDCPAKDHMPGDGVGEMDANARLIAAAPEMLTLLQSIFDDKVNGREVRFDSKREYYVADIEGGEYARIRALLARIEGKGGEPCLSIGVASSS